MREAFESGSQRQPLEILRAAGLDAPILGEDVPRWRRLQVKLAPGIDLRDRLRGALLGGAIGDAVGRPNEGYPTEVARERKLRAYQPWHGWAGGPKGTITDDTQMTMWLAESILAGAQRGSGAEAQRPRQSIGVRERRSRGDGDKERGSETGREVRHPLDGCNPRLTVYRDSVYFGQ